ncbi:MAG: 50S ribosomal protein L9 [Parasporobacterium sp.]|nr:50S ribosomal protein L9 [Parasporobacterium sp.]
MKVILIEDVKSLGKKGDVVDVSDGYARNFILPKKKGIEASAANMNDLKLKKANDEKVAAEIKANAQAVAEKLAENPVTLKVKIGDNGKLFGAIATKDIAQALAGEGIEVDKKKIVLDEPIKEVGTHTVKVKLHKDVTATLTINIIEG